MSPGFHLSDAKRRLAWRSAVARWCTALSLTALAGCAVGPDYQRPQALPGTEPPAFKESGAWKPAQPGQVDLSDHWWTAYNDAVLNQLVEKAATANQTLAQAQAQYQQAAALVPAAQSANLPTLGVSASEGRGQVFSQGVSDLAPSHAWSFQAGWEPDFWGHVSRSVELADASAQASAADYAAARLTVQASLVNNYFQLRLLDRQSDLYLRVIAGYQKALQITQAQYRQGVAAQSDVELANATLTSAQAQAADIRLTRGQLEHAIAVLTGALPAQFSIVALAPDAALPPPVQVPAIVASELLERRPDIAGAERRVAAANANIGVVRSAWFPTLTLAASYGNTGPDLANWFYTPYQAWAVGGTLAATLFDGGLRTAQNDQAKAAFEAAAAAYRQTVLAGFQEVEDNLTALAELAHEIAFQTAAVQSSRVSERSILSQYRAGTAQYTAVVTVQASTLANERAVLQLQARHYAAAVALMKALGGGWHTGAATPAAHDSKAVTPASPQPLSIPTAPANAPPVSSQS